MLNISAMFLSQKRLNEVLSKELLPHVYRLFILSNPQNRVLERASVIGSYEEAAIAWLNQAGFPTLGQLVAEGQLTSGRFFTHLGPFTGKGILDATSRFQSGKPLRSEPVLCAKLDGLREGLTLTVQAHPENYTTLSAPGELSGKKRLFFVGRLTECEGDDLRAQAYLIGHLHDEPRPGMPNADQFGRLPWQMEVFAQIIDNFARIENVQPSTHELKKLLTIPEREVKDAFATIVGEPFVPKDWGGEKSDLVTTQVRIEGMPVATAFAFKGPSVSRELRVADLGKNGDQISRLFSEPGDFVILQHCHFVTSAVRDHMRAFATRIGQLKPFCIIDGSDTVRIMKAYGQLGYRL